MAGEAELSGRADSLARAVVDLNESINELMARTEQSADQIRRSRRTVRLTVAGLILDVVLTAVMAFLLNRERQLSDMQQTVTRDVLCPLYSLLVGSYDPKRREAMIRDQQIKYDDAFAVIRQGSRALGCRT